MPAVNFPTNMSNDFSCPEPPPFDIPAGISSPYQPQKNLSISMPLDLNIFSQTLVCKPCMLLHHKMKNTLKIANRPAVYSH